MSGIQLQISKLLMVCVIAATAATGALVLTVLVGMPGPVPAPGPNGSPPPPPDLRPLAFFPIVTGVFVLCWLAVLVVFARDQVLRRIREIQDDARPDPEALRGQMEHLLAGLRAELAEDRERDLDRLDERLAEYGERRETDGYLNGMRMATGDDGTRVATGESGMRRATGESGMRVPTGENGMRRATGEDSAEAKVRSIRRTPPQR